MTDWQAHLRDLLMKHRAASGKSFDWYAAETGIHRQTLLNIAHKRGRTLYIIGRRLESWMRENPVKKGVVQTPELRAAIRTEDEKHVAARRRYNTERREIEKVMGEKLGPRFLVGFIDSCLDGTLSDPDERARQQCDAQYEMVMEAANRLRVKSPPPRVVLGSKYARHPPQHLTPPIRPHGLNYGDPNLVDTP